MLKNKPNNSILHLVCVGMLRYETIQKDKKNPFGIDLYVRFVSYSLQCRQTLSALNSRTLGTTLKERRCFRKVE